MTTYQILIKVAQLIFSLSIIVILHEFGHFITAKIFKCRVEKFYLFFDPWFSLFKIRKGETEYGIGWLPLGGYVKISGMIDESMDKEQMKQPPQPWEFRSKPTWQRLIIMVAGVTLNLILAFFIYAMILWHWGESYLPAQNMKYGIAADSLAQQIGLQDGDMILAVDHRPVDNFAAIPGDIILNGAKSLQIMREGEQKDIAIPTGFIHSLLKAKGDGFMEVRMPVIVDSVLPSAHFIAGRLEKNDRIIAFNHQPTPYYNQFLDAKKGLQNTVADLTVIRHDADSLLVKVQLDKTGLVGFANPPMNKLFDFKVRKYTFFAAIPAGFHKATSTLSNYIQQLKLIFVSKEVKASESLGGFISIGNLFPAYWDWYSFWTMTALLSIILAFMNILPIPALDGGHTLFLLYEIVTRRKPSDKFLEYAQIAGMIIIFALLFYANGLDLWRHFTGR